MSGNLEKRGDIRLTDKVVVLNNEKIISIILDELSYLKRSYVTRESINEILMCLWHTIIGELCMGNKVKTRLGDFCPYVRVQPNFGKWNIREPHRYEAKRRMVIKFVPSQALYKSIKHLLRYHDAQQTQRHIETINQRRMERIARCRKRVAHAKVGRRTNHPDDRGVRGNNSDQHPEHAI